RSQPLSKVWTDKSKVASRRGLGFDDPMETAEFKFFCSHCDQPLKCEPRFAGRQIQCPGCNHLIRIPNPPSGMGFTQVSPESGRTWDTHVPPPGSRG
ncbi:MAG: hypothetical protein RL153_620, partial [Verrucomicrobiota bacterium]